MANDGGQDARESLLAMLLDKVAEDTYPSSTMLDLIEKLIPPEDLDVYAAILLEKLADDTYPSMSMTRRLVMLTDPG